MAIPHLRQTGSIRRSSRCTATRKTLKSSTTREEVWGRQMTARPRVAVRGPQQRGSAPGLPGSAAPATAAVRPRDGWRLTAAPLCRRAARARGRRGTSTPAARSPAGSPRAAAAPGGRSPPSQRPTPGEGRRGAAAAAGRHTAPRCSRSSVPRSRPARPAAPLLTR